MKEKGLTILFTGNGKGKTTAALGQAIRAAGQGFMVCIIQFIKSNKNTGEAKALARFASQIELHTIGSGFTWAAQDLSEVKKAAGAGWELAKAKIGSGRYHMVILDEITYLLHFDLVGGPEILSAITSRPSHVHLVLTGRDADQMLIDAADLVTEMKDIKHPYRIGVAAQKGIEY